MCVIVEMNDEWAWEVEVRLQGAVSDFHVADACYHDDCRSTFMAPHSVHVAAAKCLGQSDTKDATLERLVKVMRSDTTHIWTSTEVFKLYKESGGVFLCVLVKKYHNCLTRS